MSINEIRNSHQTKTASTVEKAHHIRRRMRDLKECSPQRRDEQEPSPRFLFLRKLGPPRWKTAEPTRGPAFWFVLGAWLLFAAMLCTTVIVALHWKR